MLPEYALNTIFHIAKADFLQRTRSYYFLITLGVFVFIIYSFVPALDAGYTMVSLGNYRGFYNSAWIGSMVSMCVPFFALIGFYLINNAVKRDEDTGVGQIIATTRVSKVQYLTGKLFSNFAVLLLILLVIAAMTIVMFLVRGETRDMEPGKLLSPLFIMTVPAMFIIAALGLIFDSVSGTRRGLANVLYFFVWIFLVSSSLWSQATDVFGVNTCMLEIKNAIGSQHTGWNGKYGTGILITSTIGQSKVFVWDGMNWTFSVVVQRVFWMCAAFSLVLLASVRFNRFDTSGSPGMKRKRSWFRKKEAEQTEESTMPLKIRYKEIPVAEPGFSFPGLIKAEFQLMLSGKARLWQILSAGLFIASVFVPLSPTHQFLLPLLWFLQILILSKLGCRESENRCAGYIFSSAFPLRRQLPATICTAALVLLVLALPVILRLILSRNLYAVYAIASGALFISLFAVASGILTGGSKLFEVVFTIMVYGILNGIPWFDLTGSLSGSRELGVAFYMNLAAFVLAVLAFLGRKWQVTHTT